MRKKSGNQTLTLALSGMMAALVFVATYFFKLPVSITQGYIHLGDGFILLGASLLGWASVPAAAIGSALADLLGGYTLYILPTFVIKGLVAAVAVCALRARHPYWLTVALLVLAELVMVAGYFVTEWLLLATAGRRRGRRGSQSGAGLQRRSAGRDAHSAAAARNAPGHAPVVHVVQFFRMVRECHVLWPPGFFFAELFQASFSCLYRKCSKCFSRMPSPA